MDHQEFVNLTNLYKEKKVCKKKGSLSLLAGKIRDIFSDDVFVAWIFYGPSIPTLGIVGKHD